MEVEDRTLEEAALREAVEETGISKCERGRGILFDVDVHPIPERDGVMSHLHYDVRFMFRVRRPGVILSNESKSWKWSPALSLVDGAFCEGLRRMAVNQSAFAHTPTYWEG